MLPLFPLQHVLFTLKQKFSNTDNFKFLAQSYNPKVRALWQIGENPIFTPC
jgi:hypothetical protein